MRDMSENTGGDGTEEDTGETYTSRALDAITEAVITETDFPSWLAGVLARAAASRGSSYALIAGRPGSWEARLVKNLVCGTVGWDDEHLFTGPEGPRTDHP